MGRHGVAVFGVGRAGHIHLRNVIANHRCRLLYLVDVNQQRLKELVKEYNLGEEVKAVTPDEKEMVLKDPAVEAVFVCAPTFEHEEIVKAAVKNGKAIFCEKPVAQTVQGTLDCYDAAEKANCPLFCSFNRRFDPSVRALRERVVAGELGRVYSVNTIARDHPLPPMEYLRISGGLFHDCVVHDLDMICWVLNEYPTEVYTQATCHHEEIAAMDDVDTVAVVLKFPSKTLATIDVSRLASYGYDQQIEVHGVEGVLKVENQCDTSVVKYGNKANSTDPFQYSFPQRYKDSYIQALEHFLNVLEGKEKNEISKHNTHMISLLAQMCEDSYRQGRPLKRQEQGDAN